MKPNPSEANNHDTDLELISPDILEGMEIPVLNIEREYVANTGSKYALEKLLYFAELSLNIPAEWRDANGNPVPDFISCINTAYIVLAYTNSWGEFKDGKEQGYYTDAEYTQELKEDNEALCGRIEKKPNWRKKYENPKAPYKTKEGRIRSTGRTANANSSVSKDEMLQIMGMVRDRFRKQP